MKKYEYTWIHDDIKKVNSLGDKGWKIIHIRDNNVYFMEKEITIEDFDWSTIKL